MGEIRFDDLEDVKRFIKEIFYGRKEERNDQDEPPRGGKSKKPTRNHLKGGLGGIIILLFLVFLGTGIYQVGPDEEAVLLRFGKYTKTVGPGMHWYFPTPIGKRYVVKTTKVYRVEIGFETVEAGPPARYQNIPEESLMFTGDENMIDVDFSVQYKISNLKDYIFNVRDQYETIKSASESSLRQVVGSKGIEETLTVGKEGIQEETREKLKEILDSYGTGIMIIGLQLQDVGPPEEVMQAFKEVANAREDRARFINEADGYRNDIIPNARGQASQMINRAEAYKEKRVKESQGDVAKFIKLSEKYSLGKEVTKTRMYLETMEKTMPGIEKIIIDPKLKGSIINLIGGGVEANEKNNN
ncbi:MAG: FtsH protease activity modulator HflK [Psychrilyobacter sp.]|uniref:FtsH protease activity modulator HflK n=1 Tax=Psychrilyobacter sp. TaxID=2586924 RepID=UPI003C746341